MECGSQLASEQAAFEFVIIVAVINYIFFSFTIVVVVGAAFFCLLLSFLYNCHVARGSQKLLQAADCCCCWCCFCDFFR